MTRIGAYGCLVLSLALTAAACERETDRDQVVIGWLHDVGVLLPVVETGALDAEIDELLYLSLNSARWEDGGIEYAIDELALAEGWEFGPEGATLTYTLRDGAVWSDGHPIDTEDVVFTYELIGRPEISSPYVDFVEEIDSVVALDDRRVRFYFRRPYPGMLFDTGLGIVPAHIFEGVATDHATLTGHPWLARPESLVVSGPYRVAEWRQDERLVLAPNPRAFTGAPTLERVIFRVVPEATTRRIELQNGRLDVAHPVPLAAAAELAADPRFRIETMDDRFYDYIAWNSARFEPFSDPAVRRALSLAIDRASILAALEIQEFGIPAAGPYPPIFSDVYDPDLEPDPYLPDSARAILTRLGWRDRDADGVLERDGQPFRFTLITQAANERRTGAAEIIQAGYAEIGIRMEIRALEFGALLDQVFQARDYQATLLGWQVALEPDYLIGHFWPPDHPSNITGFASAALDSVITRAQAAPTHEAAAPYWRAAARVIAHERPYAFLWFLDDPVVVNERIENTRIDTYGIYQNLHRWRIER